MNRQWFLVGTRVIRADEIRNDPENALGILSVLGGRVRGRLNFVRQILGGGIGRLFLILRRFRSGLRTLGLRVLALRCRRRSSVLRVRSRERQTKQNRARRKPDTEPLQNNPPFCTFPGLECARGMVPTS